MPNTIIWLGHASFQISYNSTILYIDPWKLSEAPHDGSYIFISHSHYDHFSPDDIEKVSNPETAIIASADVVKKYGSGQAIKPGRSIELPDLKVTAVAAYNLDKPFHPKSNEWIGFVLQFGPLRIYYAGDTDITPEMQALENIDLAMLPVGGTYTMDPEQAAQAVKQFKPKRALPYHWGDIVGSRSDAEAFLQLADCDIDFIYPGESIPL